MNKSSTLRSVLTANDFGWEDLGACILLQDCGKQKYEGGELPAEFCRMDALDIPETARPRSIAFDDPWLDWPLSEDRRLPLFVAYDKRFVFFRETYDGCHNVCRVALRPDQYLKKNKMLPSPGDRHYDGTLSDGQDAYDMLW